MKCRKKMKIDNDNEFQRYFLIKYMRELLMAIVKN